ncbi:MAG: hypothetical protein U1E45_01580 [Geminicoccaceae bacterium]
MSWPVARHVLLAALVFCFGRPVEAQTVGGCQTVAYISQPGYQVNQAWQIYRRLPAPWCSCAKVCEPIGRLAAKYEAAFLIANAASRDIKRPIEERRRYAAQAHALIVARGTNLTSFRNCQLAMKPPPQPHAVPSGEPVELCASKNVVLTLADQWRLWCAKWESGFTEVWKKYDVDRRLPNSSYVISVKMVARNDGKTWSNGGSFTKGFPQNVARDIQNDLLAIKMPAFPPGSSIAKYSWTSTFEFAHGVPRVIPDTPFKCPET